MNSNNQTTARKLAARCWTVRAIARILGESETEVRRVLCAARRPRPCQAETPAERERTIVLNAYHELASQVPADWQGTRARWAHVVRMNFSDVL